MNTESPIIECVANISHGAQDEVLKKITAAFDLIEGQRLLDIDSSLSANRTVLTFAGLPDSVFKAAFQLFKNCKELINMETHHGTHPRMGTVDVCPFVALENLTQEDLIPLANAFAEKVGNELNIPIYLYEYSASKAYRSSLPSIRKGGYEKLSQKMNSDGWAPDFGPNWNTQNKESIQKTGATVMGVRDILVAFNVSIDTQSDEIAKEIAYRIRTIGWPKSKQKAAEELDSKKFPELRSIGWYSEDYNCAQVSCNFLHYKTTSPLVVWNTIKDFCVEYNCKAIGCEVIGLIPEACILEAGQYSFHQKKVSLETCSNSEIIEGGCLYLGFNRVRPFDPKKKVLDYRIKELMGL